MTDYHKENDAANKAILQKLADESDDAEVTAVIRCYNIGAKGSEIIKEMRKQNLPALKSCGIHLGLYPKGDTKKIKAEIITDIMTRINSLLRDLCGVCGAYFNNDLQEKPLFRCFLCHQGCHATCFEQINTLFNALDENQKKSFQFICTSCHDDHKDEDNEEITVNAPKVKKSPTKERPQTDEEKDNLDESKSVGSEKDHAILVLGDSSGDGENIEIPPSGTPANDASETQISICPDYKWGRCPNYESCQYRHPPRCWKWLTNGRCSYKNKCRFHHPPLCYQSLWEKRCLKLDCKYFHVAKTMRVNMEDEQLKSTFHSQNYHAQQSNQPIQVSTQPQLPNQHWHPNHQSNNAIYHHQPQQPIFCLPTISTQNPPYQSTSNVPRQPVHQPQNNTVTPSNNFTQRDISFLAQTIKAILREDLGKEIAEIKQKLNTAPPPNQVTPNMYSLQMFPRQQVPSTQPVQLNPMQGVTPVLNQQVHHHQL